MASTTALSLQARPTTTQRRKPRSAGKRARARFRGRVIAGAAYEIKSKPLRRLGSARHHATYEE